MQELTPAQKRYRSMSDQERTAYIAAQAERAHHHQQATLPGAARASMDWVINEDNLLMWSQRTTLDLALEFQRTYSQCAHRRAQLRRELTGEARMYLFASADDPFKERVLCACGAFDDDHESWCPNAG